MEGTQKRGPGNSGHHPVPQKLRVAWGGGRVSVCLPDLEPVCAPPQWRVPGGLGVCWQRQKENLPFSPNF